MKKLINDPGDVVLQSVEGFALAHADLVRLNRDPLYLARHPQPDEVAARKHKGPVTLPRVRS